MNKRTELLIAAGTLLTKNGWHSIIAAKMSVTRQTLNNWIAKDKVPVSAIANLKSAVAESIKEKEAEIVELKNMLACIDDQPTKCFIFQLDTLGAVTETEIKAKSVSEATKTMNAQLTEANCQTSMTSIVGIREVAHV